VIDRENIDYFDNPHVRLSEIGIFVFNLKGSYAIPRQPWTVEVTLLSKIAWSTAKEEIAAWLSSQYLATGITFLKRKSDRDNQCYVQFMRGDC